MKVRSLQTKPKVRGERGIPKHAVDEIVVTPAGVVGDYNRYRHERKKDDPAHALLLIPHETLQTLEREGWPVSAGDLGENVTTEGVPYEAFEVGQSVMVGEVAIEISEACAPCSNLAVLPYVGPARVKAFVKTLRNRRGWYARIIHGGTIRVGDAVVLSQPSRLQDLP